MRYMLFSLYWLFSNPPEADYNRNAQSTDVLLSSPAHGGGKNQAIRFAGGR